MYLKLIFYICFLLILINISIGNKCKCPENGKKKLRRSRVKRGIFCDCFGSGKRKNNSGKGSEGHHEIGDSQGQVEGSLIGIGHTFEQEGAGYGGATHVGGHGIQSYGGHTSHHGHVGTSYGAGTSTVESSTKRGYVNGKRNVLYICDNTFFSHIQANVCLIFLIYFII
ncbi:unnamed protein product [Meloidogyne enterolobii]|uniref:Uncharacterized protein n=1 Tax=Meloidogyne enterolobii TaxID=390850 RepID=A0ACB1A4X4_MELEN